VVTGTGPGAGGLRRRIIDLVGLSGAHSPTSQLAVLLGLFGALMILRALVASRRNILLIELQVGFVESRRALLAERLAAARWDQVVQVSHARVAHVLSREVQNIGSAVTVAAQSTSSILMLLAQCVLAFALAPAMAAIALCLLAAGLIAFLPMLRRSRSVGAMLAERNQSLLNITTRFLGGLKLAVSQNLQAAFIREVRATLADLGRRQVEHARQQSFGHLGLTTVTALVGAALVMIGFGVFHMAAPVLITLLLIISRMSAPAGQLQQGVQQIAFTLPSFEALKALERDLEAMPGDAAPQSADGPFPEGAIEFDKVGFRHAAAADATARGVADLDLSILPGEFLGLSGPSGAGKTTLADLLVGLYPPQAGVIRVGGRALTGALLGAWRQGLSYISQDAFLFHDTLRRNLAWMRPDASEAEMWDALAVAGADELVRRMSAGLETVAGERGTLVSGGERQRIALARALLRRPRLLVLDEATSAIDLDGERTILERLRRLQPRPTIVMIAHRPESLAFCDRILRLEDGRLASSAPGGPDRTVRPGVLAPEDGGAR
jgi:ATP-binding cassette subfamily C protein